MTAFHFLRPLWLLALLPAIALWWAYRRQSDASRRWRSAIDPDLLAHLVVGASRKQWLRPSDALLASWVLGTLAVSGPTWEREPSPFAAESPPVMIVLRVSPSMQTPDLPPTRLERATQKISDLLALASGQAAGLIAYGGSAHLVLPPTRDAAVITTMAKALAPNVMPKTGDAFADAVTLAREMLAEGGQGGSILILADEVTPAQLGQLQRLRAAIPPITILALARHMIPATLQQAADTLGADVEVATADTADVQAIARSLRRETARGNQPGETQRWRDMGWYLTPLLTVIVLFWFRRGRVIPE